MFKKFKLRKIAKTYVCVLNDLEQLRGGVISEKEAEGTDFERAVLLNGVIAKIGEMQQVLVTISREKYGLDLTRQEPEEQTQE